MTLHHQSLWGPSDKSAEQMDFPTTTGDDMRSHLRTDSRMGSIRQIRRKNDFFCEIQVTICARICGPTRVWGPSDKSAEKNGFFCEIQATICARICGPTRVWGPSDKSAEKMDFLCEIQATTCARICGPTRAWAGSRAAAPSSLISCRVGAADENRGGQQCHLYMEYHTDGT